MCRQLQRKAHYASNKTRYRESNMRRILAAQQIVLDFLTQHPCVDCGIEDIVCLEFHHTRGKELTISELIFSRRRSLSALRNEIDKCLVVCVNCHRRRHAA